jgi:hypothetical protein
MGGQTVNETWLKCDVSKGMFPDEAGVSFPAGNGELISLFCYKDFVDVEASRLKVKVVGQQDGFTLVRLPVESLNGYSIVSVSGDLLEASDLQTV